MASLTLAQLPQMDEHSLKVVVMDNCSTHKSIALRELIEDQGMYSSLSCHVRHVTLKRLYRL